MTADTESIEGRLAAMEAELASLRRYVRSLVEENEQLLERLGDREAKAQSLAADVAGLKVSRDEMIAHAAGAQQALRSLDGRMRKLEGARAQSSRLAQVGLRPAAAPAATPVPTVGAAPAKAAPAAPPPEARPQEGACRWTIIHGEDAPELQELVRGGARRWSVRYCPFNEEVPEELSGRRLLVLNLLLESEDPLALAARGPDWGIDNPSAFTYCVQGNSGLVAGMIEYFPPPMDPEVYVARLLARPRPPERLLVVSSNLDLTNSVRDAMTQAGCGCSIAFEARQAQDLIPMIRPDLMLIDLEIARGEGIRLALRLRADQKTALIPMALMWGLALDPGQFRMHVQRAARDFAFSADTMGGMLGRIVGPGLANVAGR